MNKQEINIKAYQNKIRTKNIYGKNRYHNMSYEKKQKLKEYQKHYYKTKNSQF